MLNTAIIFLASVSVICMVTIEPESMHEKIEKFSEYAELLDRSMSEEDDDQCFEKMVCAIESSESETTRNSPFDSFWRVLTNSDNDFDEDDFAELQQVVMNNNFLERLIDSFKYAKRFKNTDRCNAHYPACNTSVDHFLEGMAGLGHFVTAKVKPKKITWIKSCEIVGHACTAVTIASFLCTLVTGGACSPTLLLTAGCLATDICNKFGCSPGSNAGGPSGVGTGENLLGGGKKIHML